jgi:pSer/pThr/pTyr-binding forkhead associated (FHA) protein
LCEHPSLSRYHAILQYSDGSIDPINYPAGFYIYDLKSTHGTFMNKTKITPLKHIHVQVGSIIKFGMSTRLYVLHGPKYENKADDLKINMTHGEMKKFKEKYDKHALKMRVYREVAEEEANEQERKQIGSIDWGLVDDDEEGQNEDEKILNENPFSVIEENKESFYSDDPKKALKIFFEREGDDLEYEIEELGIGKFKCRIRLPIYNNNGEPIYAEASHEGRKKETQAACALEVNNNFKLKFNFKFLIIFL